MAKITRRTWRSRGPTGHRIRRVSFGFTTMVDDPTTGRRRRIRQYDARWQSREDAERGLAAFLLGVEEQRQAAAPRGMTLGEAMERFLLEKARHRSADEYQRIAERVLLPDFGPDTPLAQITASRISEHRAKRLAAGSVRRKDADGRARALSAASINRPLALLRHLLRTACHEWEVLADVPRVRLEREPQGRLRWLSEEEEVRLLAACRRSRNRWLAPLVTVALETGLRHGELLGLTWEQIDLSRGVIRLERTKSGRRREVPIRQVVYDLLVQWPEPRRGRLWPATSTRTAFENAVAEAQLDAPLTFHDLRHHFASWFVMRGGRLEALQAILGHTTLAMTMRYAHLAPDFVRGEMVRTERGRAPRVLAHSGHNGPDASEAAGGPASEAPEMTGAGGGS